MLGQYMILVYCYCLDQRDREVMRPGTKPIWKINIIFKNIMLLLLFLANVYIHFQKTFLKIGINIFLFFLLFGLNKGNSCCIAKNEKKEIQTSTMLS